MPEDKKFIRFKNQIIEEFDEAVKVINDHSKIKIVKFFLEVLCDIRDNININTKIAQEYGNTRFKPKRKIW